MRICIGRKKGFVAAVEKSMCEARLVFISPDPTGKFVACLFLKHSSAPSILSPKICQS